MSSVFSFSTERWGSRTAEVMESLAAIGAGLGLRYVVGVVSHNDLKMTSVLIGLWEGIILFHFVQKMRRSWDPYVAYSVRLFVDFLVTESVLRLVLILLWSGIGMVLADIAPGIWEDTGMRRIWSRFRRDLVLISYSVPTLPILTKSRTVRFSPSRTTSVVSSTQTTPAPSAISAPAARLAVPPTPRRKSRWPGALDSETETVLSNTPSTSAGYTFSAVPPSDPGTDEQDDDDIYASSTTTTSTERPDIDIPEIEVEPEPEVRQQPQPVHEASTPKLPPIIILPTPSESVHDGDELHQLEPEPEEHVVVPASADVPMIPDLPEPAEVDLLGNEDWENVRSPTPPPKDDLPPSLRGTPAAAPMDLAEEQAAPPEPEPEMVPEIPDITEPHAETTPIPDPSPSPPDPSPGDVVRPVPSSSEQQQPGEAANTSKLTPPPSFNELYPEDAPLDETPVEATAPVEASEGQGSLAPPSPVSSISVLSQTLSLRGALALRDEIAALVKQRDDLLNEHSTAKGEKAAGVKTAFTKKKEAELLEKRIAKLSKKADRRSFTANNKGAPLNKLDVSSLTPDNALEEVENRMYVLLAPGSEATCLEVTVTKGLKGRPLKSKILNTMKEYGIDVREDQNNSRLLRLTLPLNS